jgi:hypothetical protein
LPMIPISTNQSNTIGLVDMNNPKSHFIGEFDPTLLKMWAEQVAETFAGEDCVYLSIHKHEDRMNTARILAAAAEHGDSIQVVVCGVDCDDVVKKGRVDE